MNAGARSIVISSIVTAVVAVTVVTAIVILGAPSIQRRRKMDEVRVQNLTLLALSVNGYFTRHKELPADLDALAKEPGYHIPWKDPDTNRSYGYKILGTTSYRLCAEFTGEPVTDSPQFSGAYANVTWAHGQGHQCFDRTTDKIIQ